jgi:hypothetical protein
MLCNIKLEVVFGTFCIHSLPESDWLQLFACSIYLILYYLPVAGVCDIPPVKCRHSPEVEGFGLYSCPVVSAQSVAIYTATFKTVETLQRRTDKTGALEVYMVVGVNLYYKFHIM